MAAPNPPKSKTPPSTGVAADDAKLLRLGVFRDGSLVETHLVNPGDEVSVGATADSTIVLPDAEHIKRHKVIEHKDGQYSFAFNGNAEGCVSIEGEMFALADVGEQGLGKAFNGNWLRVPLSEGARGKIELGETTVLFQFVDPPAASVDMLFEDVRGRFGRHVDWNLLWSFVAMAALNFGFLLYLRTIDVPRGMAVDAIPDEFAEYLPVIEKKKKKKIDLKKLAEETGEEKKEKLKKLKTVVNNQPQVKAPICDAACQAARRARLSKAIAGLGALKILGVKGHGSGTTSDLVGGGGAGRRLDQALKGVAGVSASAAGTKFAVRGGDGAAQTAGIGDLAGRVGGPRVVGTGRMLREKVPKYSFKRKAATVEGGAMIDKNKLRRGLRRAARRVKMCYERVLRRNPTLSGKVTVRLMIGATGRARSVEIDTDTIGAGVAACIKAVMRSQSYPAPADGTAEVVVPFIFQSSK